MHTLLNLKINTYLAITIILFLIVFIWGWFSSNLVLNVPRFADETTPREYGLKYETVEFAASGGVNLKGWFVPAEKRSDTTIIVCHGWGAGKSDILSSTFFLNTRGGYNLLYFDFRNHGQSGGNISTLGRYEAADVASAVDFVKKNKTSFCRKIGVFGFSMGASAAIIAAAGRPEIMAVAAESPFSSFDKIVVRFAKLFYGIPRFPLVDITLGFVRLRLGFNPNKYSPQNYIAQLSPRPVLIIQGDSDKRMLPAEGRNLFSEAKDPKELWIVKNADHGEAYCREGRKYEIKLLDFFNKAFK
ncbi:MAG: alpha/beta hydrolase [Elusimicrobiota bacterium]